MKQLLIFMTIILGITLVGCNSRPGSKVDEVNKTLPKNQTLSTSMGDLIISENHLVDEVHNQKPPAGQKFLLLTLVQPDLNNLDPGKFPLETFQTMMQENSAKIYVKGENDNQFISTMAGWVEDEFVVGFLVDESNTYTLYWPDNPPLELLLEN